MTKYNIAATHQIPLPRGIRNNNPGNIRHSSAAWDGRSPTQPDASFVNFTTPEHGIRALARILANYQSRHHLETTSQIISRWAPPNENDTDAYIAAVARATGVGRDAKINLRSNPALFRSFIGAIIAHENGSPVRHGRQQWYDAATLDRGIAMAIGQQTSHHEDRSHHHSANSNKTLKRGDKGSDVALLQKYLNLKGAKLKVDTDFGKNTETAVIQFQTKNSLVPDGKVGKNTRKALGMP